MTAQEAIQVITDHFCNDCFITRCEHCAQSMAIKALGKQIPKRVIKTNGECFGITTDGEKLYEIIYSCPSCGSVELIYGYPCKCNQALDWNQFIPAHSTQQSTNNNAQIYSPMNQVTSFFKVLWASDDIGERKMDARELTKKFIELEDKVIQQEKKIKLMEQQIQKLQMHLGDHLCMNLIGKQI